MSKIKKKHGGKRPGSGAKKKKESDKKEPTKVIRVPVSKVDEINDLISKQCKKK